jgi:Ca-activated chloride channel family protein
MLTTIDLPAAPDLASPAKRIGLWYGFWCALAACLALVLYAAVALLAPAEAAAQQAGPSEEVHGLVLRPSGAEDANWAPAPVLESRIGIEIADTVVRGQVTQVFRNETEEWVEGTYSFPLPADAAVDRMTVLVDDRRIEGLIQEKAEARETYEAARADGKIAGLLDQARPNLFKIRLANIGPGRTVAVALDYQAQADIEAAETEMVLPLVAAPRYMPEARTAAIDHPAVRTLLAERLADARTLAFPLDMEGARNPVGLQIVLRPGGRLAGIESPSHAITVIEADGAYEIALDAGTEPANRDFILRWTLARGERPGAALFRETVDGVDYLLARLHPPKAETAADLRRPRDVTFVLDVSASMTGEAMVAAQTALVAALAALRPEDSFDVIAFNDNSVRLFGRSEAATPARIKAAIRWVAARAADGGTEMMPALESALTDAPAPGALRQIVFLTDGLIGNEGELFSLIARRLGEARLFTVALGSAPNGWFMEKAAELGRGRSARIADLGEAGPAMRAFYRGIETPVVTELVLADAGSAEAEAFPPALPDLYADTGVGVLIRAEDWDGSLTVAGTLDGEPWAQVLDAEDAAPADGIAKLWARAKIDAISDRRIRSDITGEEARALSLPVALTHRLVTPYTSFVAVDTTPARPPEADLREAPVPANRPDGWTEENLGLDGAKKTAPQRDAQAAPPPVTLAMASGHLTGPAGADGWPAKLLAAAALLLAGLALLIRRRSRAEVPA